MHYCWKLLTKYVNRHYIDVSFANKKNYLCYVNKWNIRDKLEGVSVYKGVIIVPTALYGTVAWGVRNDERRKVNVLEIKCLRSSVEVSRIETVRKEKVHIEELE